MSLIHCYQNREETRDIVLIDSAGDAITPGDNDIIRVRIGYSGTLDTTPKLTVLSSEATANGSSFTKNSPSSTHNRLVLKAADLGFSAGIYTAAFDIYDNASGGWKNVSRQVFSLERS